jgi:hypothetical protein
VKPPIPIMGFNGIELDDKQRVDYEFAFPVYAVRQEWRKMRAFIHPDAVQTYRSMIRDFEDKQAKEGLARGMKRKAVAMEPEDTRAKRTRTVEYVASPLSTSTTSDTANRPAASSFEPTASATTKPPQSQTATLFGSIIDNSESTSKPTETVAAPPGFAPSASKANGFTDAFAKVAEQNAKKGPEKRKAAHMDAEDSTAEKEADKAENQLAKKPKLPDAAAPFKVPNFGSTATKSPTKVDKSKIELPKFTTAGVNFSNAFAQKAAEDAKAAAKKAMEDAKDEDMDSDEDEAEWEAKYYQKLAAEKRDREEKASKLEVPKFAFSTGAFVFGSKDNSSKETSP